MKTVRQQQSAFLCTTVRTCDDSVLYCCRSDQVAFGFDMKHRKVRAAVLVVFVKQRASQDFGFIIIRRATCFVERPSKVSFDLRGVAGRNNRVGASVTHLLAVALSTKKNCI